jgi:hypothetical protein
VQQSVEKEPSKLPLASYPRSWLGPDLTSPATAPSIEVTRWVKTQIGKHGLTRVRMMVQMQKGSTKHKILEYVDSLVPRVAPLATKFRLRADKAAHDMLDASERGIVAALAPYGQFSLDKLRLVGKVIALKGDGMTESVVDGLMNTAHKSQPAAATKLNDNKTQASKDSSEQLQQRVQMKAEKTPALQPMQRDDNPTKDATFEDVKASADGSNNDKLDLTWIDALPEHVRASIDGEFSEGAQASRRRAATKSVDTQHLAAVKQLRKVTKQRLQKAKQPAKDADIDADAVYQSELATLADGLGAQQAQALQAEKVYTRKRGKVDETIAAGADGAATQVTWEQGRASQRTNFMSFVVEIFGSASKAKAHFRSLRMIPNSGGLWLMGAAADRFEKARDEFEQKFPSFTFPKSDVGFSTRGRHQTRQGLGMLGHLLGIAFDLLAYENPNQVSGAERFLLKHFGGEKDDETGEHQHDGRTMINLGSVGGDQAVEDLGRATVEGNSTPSGQAVEAAVRQQFDEMTKTSDRFRNYLAGSLPGLEAAMALSVEAAEKRDEAATAAKQKDLAKVIREAAKQFPYPKLPKGTPAEVVAAERRKIDELRLDYVASKLPGAGDQYQNTVKDGWGLDEEAKGKVKKAMDPLTIELGRLQTEVEKRSTEEHRNLAPSKVSLAKTTEELRRKPAKWTSLNAFRNAHAALFEDVSAQDNSVDPAAYKDMLLQHLKTLESARNDQDEIDFLKGMTQRVLNPTTAIGPLTRDGKGGWKQSKSVSAPSILQYAQQGFVANHQMPTSGAGQPGRMQRAVFNREVMVALVRYGFSPGSTYGDTMHFDFIEGDNAIPGQRKVKNMSPSQFGPKGKLNHE